MDNILLWFRGYKNNYELALRVIVALIILVLFLALLGTIGAMTAVILDYDIKADIMNYTGYTDEKDKPELIRLIGWGMGSIAVALGSVVTFLWISTSKDKQNKLTEKRDVHERFKVATEHLSNEKNISVRIASFNEFYHIAEIEPDFRKNIFNLLCTHLRQTTKHKDYKNNLKPTEEVQSLLDVLFKPKNEDILIFKDLEANLAEIHLRGAYLQKADLQGANLQEANLQKAKMQEANLQGTNLQEANLQEANLQKADLRYAKMQEANLQDANLRYADLRYAKMQEANLQDANLRYAKMQEANLRYAKMQEANLQRVNLQDAKIQGVNLQDANLQDANLQDAKMQGVNLQDAKMQGVNLQDANLQYANLQGTHLQMQLGMQEAELQGADLLGAEINEATTVMPDNWKDVVKLYDDEDGEKRPFVVVVDDEGNIIGRY